MTGRAKRLTLAAGVAAMVAVIAGSVMVSELLAAPKEKTGKQSTDFRITTDERVWEDGWTFGGWEIGGALEDHGTAYGGPTSLTLWHWRGDWYGSMEVELEPYDPEHGTFVIVSATKLYASLQGATGSYRARWKSTGSKLRDPGPCAEVHRTLEGSIP